MASREILVVDEEQFPSNSNKSKEAKEKVKIEKVVSKNVRKKKKSIAQKAGSAVFEGDTRDVGNSILWDVIVPAAKSLLSDIVKNGIEMLLYGSGSEDHKSYRDRGRSYVSYERYYDRKDDRGSRSSRNRAVHDFDDILFDSRYDAEHVLTRLVDIVEDYDTVSVADFYELAGIESSYTDRNWGWDSLGKAYVDRTRDGYVIRFPRTIPID